MLRDVVWVVWCVRRVEVELLVGGVEIRLLMLLQKKLLYTSGAVRCPCAPRRDRGLGEIRGEENSSDM